jgi:8-oxo-dGTP diphosphatase
MNLLREIRDSDVFPDTHDQDPTNFTEKQTARMVLLDSMGRVALVHVGRYNQHKLPGGGIEPGESPEKAVERELLEEMGRKATLLAEIGTVVEYTNEKARKLTSYGYLGQQIGDVAAPTFTDSESANRYTEVWAPDIDAAIVLVESDQVHGSRKFIQARELAFLRAAKPLIG